jgi:hypothetical protein
LISHSRHPSPSLAFLSLIASLAHRVSRRHARDRQRLDLLRLDRRHRRRLRPRVAFARASVASSRRFVDSFRVARRRFDAARLVARRASRRRASDVRRRRPSRVVAVCRVFVVATIRTARRVDDATVRVVRVVVSDGPCAPGFDPRASAIFDATPSRARRRRPWRRCTRG